MSRKHLIRLEDSAHDNTNLLISGGLQAGTRATTGPELARKRQLLIFDRFLARIVAVLGDAATLKGGLVLELRIERARTTKDIDLRMTGSPDGILPRLQEAAHRNPGDFMIFEVGPDDEHPDIQNDGMQYDGLRFRAECRLAGKIYGQPFGVDVAFGDPILGEPEVVVADDVLGFAGIPPPTLRVYGDAHRREATRVHDATNTPKFTGKGFAVTVHLGVNGYPAAATRSTSTPSTSRASASSFASSATSTARSRQPRTVRASCRGGGEATGQTSITF